MIISNEKPPIWDEANKLFKLEELKLGTIFAYGDTLYNPFDQPLTQDLIVHEMRHAEQQGHDRTIAGLWWKRYLADLAFRLSQEVEAYGEQYRYFCTIRKDRNEQNRILIRLGDMLAGPMYGNMVDPSEARRLIRIHSFSEKKGV